MDTYFGTKEVRYHHFATIMQNESIHHYYTLESIIMTTIIIPLRQWHVCHMQVEHPLQLKHDQALALIAQHQHLLKPVIICHLLVKNDINK